MQITRIEPFKNPEVVAQIVTIYQQSFGNEPWNEGYKCVVCEHVIPLGNCEPELCSACIITGNLIPMVPYWPTEKVMGDFYREMGKRDAVCLVAKDGEEVIGFAWGYKIEMNESTNKNLEAPRLHIMRTGCIPYLDEVAVSPPYRRKGVAELLVRTFCGYQDGQPLLLRTLGDSPMSRLVDKMNGLILLCISQKRVIAEIPAITNCK